MRVWKKVNLLKISDENISSFNIFLWEYSQMCFKYCFKNISFELKISLLGIYIRKQSEIYKDIVESLLQGYS